MNGHNWYTHAIEYNLTTYEIQIKYKWHTYKILMEYELHMDWIHIT